MLKDLIQAKKEFDVIMSILEEKSARSLDDRATDERFPQGDDYSEKFNQSNR